jgi:hypothetical protein
MNIAQPKAQLYTRGAWPLWRAPPDATSLLLLLLLLLQAWIRLGMGSP